MKIFVVPWTVRDKINECLEAALPEIVADLVQLCMDGTLDVTSQTEDEEEDTPILHAIDRHLDIEELTADEMDHVLFWVEFYVTVEYANRRGVITDVDGFLRLVEEVSNG